MTAEDVKRKLTAILSADVQGFCRYVFHRRRTKDQT